jgi:hypothetical protein
MRSVICIPLVALVLTACGGNSGYGSAQNIAKASDCANFKTSSTKDGVTVGECSYKGHFETVMWLPATISANGWRSLGNPHHSNMVLFDGQWIVRCTAAADCATFKDKLGGAFE